MKITEFQKENLKVKVYQENEEMASVAADFVTEQLNLAIREKGCANLIVGTGGSQISFFKYLLRQNIEWGKINLFHLDEYKGMPETHPASFRRFLKDRILVKVKPKEVFFLDGDAPDTEAEMLRYETLLKENPVDVACIGIGENGHIAFNDPSVADFNDPKLVKVVQLDEACRKQQLGEGWFPTLEDVPKEAITLTVTAIMNCKTISCVVPEQRKAQAVYNTLTGEITLACPATILRKHSDAILFLDSFSSEKLSF